MSSDFDPNAERYYCPLCNAAHLIGNACPKRAAQVNNARKLDREFVVPLTSDLVELPYIPRSRKR